MLPLLISINKWYSIIISNVFRTKMLDFLPFALQAIAVYVVVVPAITILYSTSKLYRYKSTVQ